MKNPEHGSSGEKINSSLELREKTDPMHKAELAMDKIARLTKTMDALFKRKDASSRAKKEIRAIHDKVVKINDKLNNALSKSGKEQEKTITEALKEFDSAISGSKDLEGVRKFAINEYKGKMEKLLKVQGNQNYQEVFENMTGMFSLMNDKEAVSILGAKFTKKGNDLVMKQGKRENTYSFYIVEGQYRIINRKTGKEEDRYQAQYVNDVKNLPSEEVREEGYAYSEKTGDLTKKAAEGVKEIPKEVQKYVKGCKEGVKQTLKDTKFMNPPTPFIREFVKAVDPKNPDKGVKKLTAFRNRLQEYDKKLDNSINYDNAQKFENNVVKALATIIIQNTPNNQIAQKVGEKFPNTQTSELIASYNKPEKGPAKASDASFASRGPEKGTESAKFNTLVKKGSEKYVTNLDAKNGFKLKGVEDIQIQQVFDRPGGKRINLTIQRKNGEQEKAEYNPGFKNYISMKTGERIRIHDGDTVTFNKVENFKKQAEA